MKQLLAVLLVAACSLSNGAKLISTPADFLDANADQFECLSALLERSGLRDALTNSDLNNTYFLPTDNAFVTDLADAILPSVDPTSSNSQQLTVEQIVAMIQLMPAESAIQFLKTHVVPANYPTVASLAYPNGLPATPPADDDGEEPTPSSPVVKNSQGEDVEVVYSESFHTLMLTINREEGPSNAYVAGPISVPVGESTVYVMLQLMADPTLITSNAALVPPSPSPAPATNPAPKD